MNAALVHYHFGSMEALLQRAAMAALMEAVAEPTMAVLGAPSLDQAWSDIVDWIGRVDETSTSFRVMVEVPADLDPEAAAVLLAALLDGLLLHRLMDPDLDLEGARHALAGRFAQGTTRGATLRSEGVAPGRVGRLIGAESLLVVALGIPPGLLAGYLVAKGFMASFSSDLFRFDLAVRPVTFLLAAAAMLAVGLVSWWPALRAIRRVDLATVLRERAG